MRWWALVICLVACKDKLEWNEHKLRSFEIGGIKFEIPKGWRDLSEAADPRLARMTHRLGSDTDAHIIVREDAANTDTNIAFMLAELVGAPTCDQFAGALDGRRLGVDRSTVLAQQYGSDRGCSFWINDGKLEGKMFLRFQGAKFLTLQCLRPKQGDADADATCERLAAVMAAQ